MKDENFFSKYKWLLIIGGILIVLFAVLAGAYNNFVVLDQNVAGKWSEVENQYQRQADLIPNLVSTVSSAVTVEVKLLNDVTNARSKWQTSNTFLEKDIAGVEMNNGITALIKAVSTSENYPELQSNKQYVALTDELTGTQNRISVARGRYIETVQSFNTAIKTFPNNLLAGMFGFAGKEYYKAAEGTTTPILGDGKLQ